MKIKISKTKSYYINLDSDIKRKEETELLFKTLNISNYKRFPASYMPENRFAANAQSHYQLLSVLEPKSIVFEDDCTLLYPYDEIEIPNDADALYLGLSRCGTHGSCMDNDNINFKYEDVDGFNHLVKIDGMYTLHAILFLTQRCINAYRDGYLVAKNNGMNGDLGIINIIKDFNIYALKNPMVYQEDYVDLTKITISQ